MIPHETRPVIRDIFHLTLVYNTGGAFGLLRDRNTLFLAVSSVVSVVLLVQLFKAPAGYRFALGLILGGAWGNMIDRLRLGHVIDFLDFRVWPVFNLADTAISIGVALMAVLLFLTGPPLSSYGQRRHAPVNHDHT